MARTPLIAGNWKMNKLRADALALVNALAEGAGGEGPRPEIVICPPATLLHSVQDFLNHKPDGAVIGLGGQDCHADGSGAHTGDISAEMLGDAGCGYVIVGHSERRQDHAETDADVRAKAKAVHEAGLIAIVCVGETQAEREAGQALATVIAQVDASLPEEADAENTVIAYEPIWAIGTGLTATPEEAQEVHREIRLSLVGSHGPDVSDGMRILYGGSMKPDNAAELLAQTDIDGGLIGGASLKAADFLKIIAAAG